MIDFEESFDLHPRIIPGSLHLQNSRCQDWGSCGLLAYGCQHHIIIMDPKTLQIVQTLSHHEFNLTCFVQWVPSCIQTKQSVSTSALLFSADEIGDVVVYNVGSKQIVSKVSHGKKPLDNIRWINATTSQSYNIISLSEKCLFTLWDSLTGVMLWKHRSLYKINTFALNPNNNLVLTVYSKFWFECWKGFRFGTENFISSDKISIEANVSGEQYKNYQPVLRTFKESSSTSYDEIISISYMPAAPDCVLILTNKHVYVVNTEYLVPLSICPNKSNVIRAIPFWNRDGFALLLNNGCISLYTGYKSVINSDPCELQNKDIVSSVIFKNSNFLHIKKAKWKYKCVQTSNYIKSSADTIFYNFIIHPITEIEFAVFINYGSIYFYSLFSKKIKKKDGYVMLNNILPSPQSKANTLDKSSFYLISTKFYHSLCDKPSCVSICPNMVDSTSNTHTPLCLVGYKNGLIELVDLKYGSVLKIFNNFHLPIRKMAWITMQTILVFAKSSDSNSKVVLGMFNISSGHVHHISVNGIQQGNEITWVSVSNMRSYFVVIIANQPSQLWSFEPLKFLQNITIGNDSYIITANWACGYMKDSGDNIFGKTKEIDKESSRVRKYLLCYCSDGYFHHFRIENDELTKQSKMLLDVLIGNVTKVLWKNDLIVIGDSLGNLNVWCMNAQTSKTFPTKGADNILKLKFAPGKNNFVFFALFTKSIQIWNAASKLNLKLLNFPSKFNVVDVDWMSPEYLVVIFNTGLCQIIEIKMSNQNFINTEINNFKLPILAPVLLPCNIQQIMKSILIWTPWRLNESAGLPKTCQEDKLPSYIEKILHEKLSICEFPMLKQSDLPLVTRALVTSLIMGNGCDFKFWRFLTYCIITNTEKTLTDCTKKKLLLDSICSGCCFDSIFEKFAHVNHLKNYKLWQYMKISQYSSKLNKDVLGECIKWFVILGYKEEAFNLLLQTNPTDPSYYSNQLRALSISTTGENIFDNSLLKLIASTLIANKKLLEGLELLYISGNFEEAIKYLISNGLQESAFWLAKVTYDKEKFKNYFSQEIDSKNYPENYEFSNLKGVSLHMAMSMGNFAEAVKKLRNSGEWSKAMLLIEACKEFDLINTDEIEEYDKLQKEYSVWLQSISLFGGYEYFSKTPLT